jgi:hypothetical protein
MPFPLQVSLMVLATLAVLAAIGIAIDRSAGD